MAGIQDNDFIAKECGNMDELRQLRKDLGEHFTGQRLWFLLYTKPRSALVVQNNWGGHLPKEIRAAIKQYVNNWRYEMPS